MNANRVQLIGAAGALLTTLGLFAAMNAYVTQIQKSAPRIVVQMEPVTVIGKAAQPKTAALANPHVGEI